MKILKIFLLIIVFSLTNQKTFSDIEVSARHLILQDHHSGEIVLVAWYSQIYTLHVLDMWTSGQKSP